ncbi:MAG: hypothetical protein HWN51_05765 [Desulfobacterales bacterium]|nr:hypothetical protein [Desulfobacterales bacterium]
MPHKRSREARIRRTAARIVSTNSHRDREKSESINIVSNGVILKSLIEKLPRYKIAWLIPASKMFERGEVIADSRGQGSQQNRVT